MSLLLLGGRGLLVTPHAALPKHPARSLLCHHQILQQLVVVVEAVAVLLLLLVTPWQVMSAPAVSPCSPSSAACLQSWPPLQEPLQLLLLVRFLQLELLLRVLLLLQHHPLLVVSPCRP